MGVSGPSLLTESTDSMIQGKPIAGGGAKALPVLPPEIHDMGHGDIDRCTKCTLQHTMCVHHLGLPYDQEQRGARADSELPGDDWLYVAGSQSMYIERMACVCTLSSCGHVADSTPAHIWSTWLRPHS